MTYEYEKENIELNDNKYLSMDLGINNLCACVDSNNESFIIDGKKLKSYNQFFNKQRSYYQSKLKNNKTSKRLQRLNRKHNNLVNDYLNKAVNQIKNIIKEKKIKNIVIEYNKGLKNNGIKNTKLKEKEYHLVITPEYIDDSQYFCIPYVEEDLLLSLPLNHPLASKKEIKFHDLDGQTMLLYSNIGFWHDLHMQKTPKTKYLLQEERLTFNEIVKASTLPSYTSNLSIKREGKMSDRIILPIDEEEAHVTYYVVMLKKNKKKYKDLIDKIEHYYDY